MKKIKKTKKSEELLIKEDESNEKEINEKMMRKIQILLKMFLIIFKR